MTYPALELLVQGYLNQDWPEDYADVWAGLDDFLASEPLAVGLVDELTHLLDPGPSEVTLRAVVLDQLDCCYLPEGDGLRMDEWLEAVRTRARAWSSG